MLPVAPGQAGAPANMVVAGADAAQATAGGALTKVARPRQSGRAVLGAVGNPQMIKNALTRLCLPGELRFGGGQLPLQSRASHLFRCGRHDAQVRFLAQHDESHQLRDAVDTSFRKDAILTLSTYQQVRVCLDRPQRL